MHGNFIQYWVNQIPVQFSLYINPNWNLNPSFLTLIIKLLGHLVFMGAIQCSAKRVYPPKDFRYHLLTKNHHQYLKERVFNNFAVRLRKSLIPEKYWLSSDHHHNVQYACMTKPQNHKVILLPLLFEVLFSHPKLAFSLQCYSILNICGIHGFVTFTV